MIASFYIDGRLAIYLQCLVKRVNGRFKTNLSTSPGDQYVCIKFLQPSTYNEFVAKLRIMEQRFF